MEIEGLKDQLLHWLYDPDNGIFVNIGDIIALLENRKATDKKCSIIWNTLIKTFQDMLDAISKKPNYYKRYNPSVN